MGSVGITEIYYLSCGKLVLVADRLVPWRFASVDFEKEKKKSDSIVLKNKNLNKANSFKLRAKAICC